MPTSRSPFRIALNGYGRIGRCILRAWHERGDQSIEIVALNDIADPASIEYLTRFDSTHGRFPGEVRLEDEHLYIDSKRIRVLRQPEPEAIDWHGLDLDLLLECSGRYASREQGQRFIEAGVPRLLFSQPMASESAIDATVVYGVNHTQLPADARLVSNASCTTNCSVPILRLLNQALGLEFVSITTIHSAMNDQPVIDAYHDRDLRRTRSAFQSIIPVSTGLARGIERLLPELSGRVQAKAVRVPTLNVSALDITLLVSRDTSAEAVNQLLADAAAGPFKGLLAYSELPHASCDFNHDPHSAIVDGSQTLVSGPRLVNLLVWFDNEWGFANRMLDVAGYWLGLEEGT